MNSNELTFPDARMPSPMMLNVTERIQQLYPGNCAGHGHAMYAGRIAMPAVATRLKNGRPPGFFNWPDVRKPPYTYIRNSFVGKYANVDYILFGWASAAE